MRRQCCPKLPYRKVTHVIFDLDGTIIDTDALIEEVLTEICKRHDKTYSTSLHNKTAGSCVEDIAKLLITELELPITQEEFVELYKELAAEKYGDIELRPGAEQLIRHLHLHGIPIAVVTSSTEDIMLLKTEKYRPLFDLFHHIVCGGSDPAIKSGKPAPDIFIECACRFDDNPDPANCLVLEDAPNGIKGALRAGMQAVMIPQDDVPYDIWKTATMRLDTLEYMAPELFGLPPFNAERPSTSPIVPEIVITGPVDEPLPKDTNRVPKEQDKTRLSPIVPKKKRSKTLLSRSRSESKNSVSKIVLTSPPNELLPKDTNRVPKEQDKTRLSPIVPKKKRSKSRLSRSSSERSVSSATGVTKPSKDENEKKQDGDEAIFDKSKVYD